MIEKMIVTFYRVAKCGYYAYGAEDSVFGSMADLQAQVAKWSKGKILADTKLMEPSGDGEDLPIYLFGMNEHGGSSLITIWNEVPSTADGKMRSVSGADPVGAATLELNSVKAGTIPGFSTYFWLVPDEDVIATLRFENSITAQRPFQAYCEQFLSTSSTYAVQLPPAENDEDNELVVYGYRKSPKDKANPKLQPRFRTVLYTKPGEHDVIMQRVADITKVHRRVNLELKAKDDRDTWQKVLSFMHLAKPPGDPRMARVRSSMSMSVSEQQLEKIIEDWRKSGGSQWDDYGFQFKGSSTVHWLSSASARGEFQVDVERDKTNTQIDGKKLLEEVMKRKTELLKLLK